MTATNAYYNECDPKAAAWLRELIRGGHIAPGDVDERRIQDVKSSDLTNYAQCHFFAGIGGWSLALRLAGVPDDARVWTGSCPCQPFSAAGKGLGTADERHLWPVFANLIRECRPAIVFGEQVASKAGREWLAGVFADLEGMEYRRAAADLCAAGVGEKGYFQAEAEYLRWCASRGGDFLRGHSVAEILAFADYLDGIVVGPPHIRQRLYWVADATSDDQWGERKSGEVGAMPNRGRGAAFRVEHSDSAGPQSGRQAAEANGHRRSSLANGNVCGVEHAPLSTGARLGSQREHVSRPTAWSNFDVIPCRDGKARRVEPGVFPLAHGVPGRVGLLRGYGNAIVPPLAAEFIGACLEAMAAAEGGAR